QSIETLQSTKLVFPEGAVALDSPFYVERSGIETLCSQTLAQPGSLMRIKAPKLMGKTSLINRMLAYAKEQVGEAVYLDLGSCDRSILTNSDKFLRRLCALSTQQLGLENRLNDYWDTDILGSNDNCTAYFEEYLLPQLDGPLVLALDESDRLFAYPDVAEDVLGMLRSWHEKGKVSLLWQRLRLVIAHSTEIYIPLDINQSPFNAGLPIELKEFSPDQVMALAQLHGLVLSPQQIPALMEVVCGHPYLIRLALYKLCTGNATLEQLIAHAACESGIYSAHLRRHLEVLQQSPDLIPALQQVVEAKAPVALGSIATYKLHSMGLVQLVENCVVPRCDLYRQYFCRSLKM
ncbi:MAG: AAA-like domain-containing protein, partial [Cyanobacteria bacterium J06555_13]